MNAKQNADQLRRKARSLETMLSRARVYAVQLEKLTEAAVTALEKTNNGEIKEAVRIIVQVRSEIRAARVAETGKASDKGGVCPACQEITCDDGCHGRDVRH